ncbi:MAG TPA: hypothetical protein VGQ83_06830 [Polyangia bacterium]
MRSLATVILTVAFVVPWGALVGCTASETGVEPPGDQVFFPTGLAVDPRGDVLYVTNGNSDLRYNGGTLLALDLTRLRADLDAFNASGTLPAPLPGAATTTDCRRDVMVPYLLECRTQRYATWKDQTIKLGNFAGQIAIAGVGTAAGARLFIPIRGEPSLTWVEAGRPGGNLELNCGNGGPLSRCGDGNRISELTTVSPVEPLPGEPYGVFADAAIGTLYVTSFAVGPVSLFDIHEVAGLAPQYADQRGGLFTADASGRQGSVSVAPRPCRSENGIVVEGLKPDGPCDPAEVSDGTFVYATSHYSNEIAVLAVRGAGGPCDPGGGADPCNQSRDLRLISASRIKLDAVDPANDNRGMAFSADGTRLFIIDRHPPGLLAIDTSLEEGLPRNKTIDVIALCPEPSLLYLEQVAGHNRAYVVCFASGGAYVVDPDEMRVVDEIRVGQGPNAMAFSLQDPARPLGFVANYVENDIAVLDLKPGSPTENQVIARIGFPAPAAVH